MRQHPFYLLYGLLVLAATGYAEYRGWSFQRATELNGVPKTVRDNPGAYRSHYSNYTRYMGGK